jgi:hypothetical protein
VILKPVPKPEGQEFMDRRASVAANASLWLPENALYDAWLDMQTSPPVKSLIVAWYAQNETGQICSRLRLYNETTNDATALSAEVFHWIMRRTE